MKVTTATLTLLWKAYPLQWALSEAGPRSWAVIQSIQNTMGQNRIERNCTLFLGLPLPSVALRIVVHPCAQLEFCFCHNTLFISRLTSLPVEVPFMEV